MQLVDDSYPITAVVYDDGAAFEVFLAAATDAMAARGLRLAGLIQQSRPHGERRQCDIHLRDLASGDVHGISDDRGPHARGCRLDTDRLLRAAMAAERRLSAETDLLVLCKFGKTEAAGGGFRSLIAAALERAVPVLIGVPRANLQPFRAFSAGLAREVELSEVGGDLAPASG